MVKALEDITVVDLTDEMWGGLASALLGDFGADVIRVDDVSRSARDPDRDGRHPSEAFDSEAELIHRNKRSLALDLSAPEGREVLGRLLRGGDVLRLRPAFFRARSAGFRPRHGRRAERRPRLRAAVRASVPAGPSVAYPPSTNSPQPAPV